MFNPLEEQTYREYSKTLKTKLEELERLRDKLKTISESSHVHNSGYIELSYVVDELDESIKNLSNSIGRMDVFIQDRRR